MLNRSFEIHSWGVVVYVRDLTVVGYACVANMFLFGSTSACFAQINTMGMLLGYIHPSDTGPTCGKCTRGTHVVKHNSIAAVRACHEWYPRACVAA
jgi:hypothetical protein